LHFEIFLILFYYQKITPIFLGAQSPLICTQLSNFFYAKVDFFIIIPLAGSCGLIWYIAVGCQYLEGFLC